jgi:hypothetical protein
VVYSRFKNTTKSFIFWNIILCSPLKVKWWSGGTCHLILAFNRLLGIIVQKTELFITTIARTLNPTTNIFTPKFLPFLLVSTKLVMWNRSEYFYTYTWVCSTQFTWVPLKSEELFIITILILFPPPGICVWCYYKHAIQCLQEQIYIW